jgi:small subunit ribosomal protein S16
MVTIRLSRGGAKKKPFYHIDVKDSRTSRDGRYIERLGYFNPGARGGEDRLVIDLDRVTHWKSVGAKTSDRVANLIKQASKVAAA